MEVPARRAFWRTSRKIFRWLRIAVWLLLLTALVVGIYLNQFGLPDFLKRPLLEDLRRRGIDIQFTRLRLSWHRGFVAENVSFRRADATAGPRLFAAELQIRPDTKALTRLRLGFDGLVIHQGKLVWPLPETHRPATTLMAEEVETDLRFLPDDQWKLHRFAARFAGAQLQISGTLAHASAIRDWTIFKPEPSAPAGQLEEKLIWLVAILSEVHFAGVPQVRLELHGDARDPLSVSGFLTAAVRGAATPWGAVTNATLSANLSAPRLLRGLPPARLDLRAGELQTRWAGAKNLTLTAHFTPTENQTNALDAELELAAGATVTKWAAADSVKLAAQWRHSLTNPIPLSGNGDLRLTGAKSQWGDARTVHLRAQMQPAEPGAPQRADESWAGWAKIEPYSLDGQVEIAGLNSPELQAGEITCAARWRAPDFVLTNLHTKLYGGELKANADLNVATRAANFQCASDFDVEKLAPLLTQAGRRWLLEFAWEKPPKLTARGSAILPAWTNREPDWRAEVQPTVRLEGELQTGAASYRGVQVSSARTHFFYSNLCWHLPDLHITRPEGQADLVLVSSDQTRDIYWRINADIDPKALKPLMDEPARRALGHLTLTQPPHVEGEVWASRREKLPRGFVGQVTLSNFTFRGQSASSLQTATSFTNQVIEFLSPKVSRPDGIATAEKIRVDLAAERVFLTNAYSTTDPMAIARAIGPKTAKAVANYQFLQPPEGRVNGVVPFHGTKGADMFFELDGGPFRWWRFNLPRIKGTVHWAGEEVTLNVADADFYAGKINGSAFFDSSPLRGADFRFDAVFTNANLQLLMRDISTRTNRLEGLLTGRLRVDDANSEDWESWQGGGEVHLRDGYVWEIPLFSIFTPVLNGIVPGLGSTRFSDGAAAFSITNSVIGYEDLTLRAPLLRMKFRGHVDFHEKVNAKVEAELLRDTWIIGPLVSTALWPLTKILEYKVTGTLDEPKAEPLYVPKVLLLPLQPFRLLKGLFPDNTSRTNAPPDPDW